ncbi:AAA family ATPase [Flammeovirga yaeyamensis]|uniref:AAA family ATPase n=1 Tax=Flammeovirga yaeyamensis TaxID=367791 RepID=A0AAX1MZ33_9BACT|nr:AAA domain-containing protein [Flammeovirga yaeyamensis]MBB3695985.1 superfamily I DNA and/or RNA helicase [Flammeovirga yaeyamensis]NMF34671.1 AAA family ATPase [Flammeovirga yaeyamensis]QWG00499.1 AAA family ATPase [Flammeovirga yaeyamensis]
MLRESLNDWEDYLTKLISNNSSSNSNEFDPTLYKIQGQLAVIKEVRLGVFKSTNVLNCLHNPSVDHLGKDTETHNIEFFNKRLNSNQQNAVQSALLTDDYALIQGPPGTGKTTVITEICRQLYHKNAKVRVLITSETHVAVNNVLENLIQYYPHEKIFRIGNKEEGSDIPTLNVTLNKLHEQYLNHFNGEDSFINTIFNNLLADESRKSMEFAFASSVNFVGMTCNKISTFKFPVGESRSNNILFDYVIIDEAAKATFPELLLALSKADKAIIVGDPKQLPPVFCMEEIELQNEMGLDLPNKRFIDFLYKNTPKAKNSFLNKQFRMPYEIGNLVSECFYEGKLENGLDKVVVDPLVWVDYSNKAEENKWPKKGSKVVCNLTEVDLIIKTIKKYKLSAEDTIILSPYKRQIKLIKDRLLKESLNNYRVFTIDAVQGKDEKNIIYSLTRNVGSMRFFSEPRRLNVSFSRVKERMFIIGSSFYAKKSQFLKPFYEKSKKIYFDNL